ncbi:FG-GAP-like repeat-containing protein [Streptomyces halobius]|uniref:FG-GAP-like repeat-containing protein n=1 Tax=Streptomyces halobius TaxID=2879846 RepID=A0ABY4MKY5_9ACTN|nr:FG-GAP-like repeat-containing protein [Streptomyces halobius]UQA97091.1 FG-GAP-like repeat-containing protein [Streptomyces halobius]
MRSSHRLRRPIRAASAAILLAAPLTLSAAPAQAVAGDPVPAASYEFTARLDIGGGQRACSGALVSPQWIATAANCFADDPATGQATAGKPKWKTTATIGRTDLTTAKGQVRQVVELVPRQDRNIVLARLAQPTTGITPVPFATAAPKAGQELKTAGFGRTQDEWVPNKLHTAAFQVDSLADATLRVSGKSASDAICKGDAGAPLVRETNGALELVALATGTNEAGCFGSETTGNAAISARLDNTVGGNTLTPGTTLLPGDTLTSNAARLTMQEDGDLVIVSNAGKPLWSTGTAGRPGATARFTDQGNLTVLAADGSTQLWESKTSAPGGKAVLQHRGNFVIHNAKGASQWASGTVVRHDYNGDGRSDLADWYDYGDGHDEIHAFTGKPDGGFNAPIHGWKTAAGNYWAENMKRTTGDFNGDGIGDVAAVYGYSDGRVKLITWLGTGDGHFRDPLHSWSVPAGQWVFSHMNVQAGDFNGDGRDDIAVWYAYDDGRDKLFTFTAKPNGGFNAPAASHFAPAGWYNAAKMKFATGDYNGDGRDDLAVFYGYSDGTVKLLTFLTKPNGGFNAPTKQGWESATGWNFDQASVHSGDFNGDGRDDLATWYDYGDGHDSVIGFNPSGPDGTFGNRTELWTVKAGSYYRENMKIATGDFNGDGRDDLATVYGYSDGRVKTITWTAKTNGTLNGPLHSWETPAGNWTFDRMHVIERYSPA